MAEILAFSEWNFRENKDKNCKSMLKHTPVHLELLVQHQRKETSDKRVLVERVLVLVQVK